MEQAHWHEDIKKHSRCCGLSIVNFEKIPHLFLVFNSWILGSVASCVYQERSKYSKSKNYETCKDRSKLCYINQAVQTRTWKETCIEFIKYAGCRLWANIYEMYWDFHSTRIISLQKKKLVETISVAITDSSNVRCLDLYLIIIFTKSAKAERCTNITFKLTLYCLSVTVEDLNL